MACCGRYDHVGCSIHVKNTGLTLKARPWHAAWRPVVGHHFLNKCALESTTPFFLLGLFVCVGILTIL